MKIEKNYAKASHKNEIYLVKCNKNRKKSRKMLKGPYAAGFLDNENGS